MKSLLVTSSLLDSFSWYKECPSSWKERAEADLVGTVFRVYSPMKGAVKRGIEFEARVVAGLGLEREVFVAAHGEMLAVFHDACHGGILQATVKRTVTVDGQGFVLYGKADILFPGKRIIDIKTTGRWKGTAAYTSRAQHLLYIAASGIEDFLYLVAVGQDASVHQAPDTPAVSVWKVDAVEPVDASMPKDEAMERLESRIRQWMAFLETHPELKRAYETVFTR